MRIHAAGGPGRAGEHAALKSRSANRRGGGACQQPARLPASRPACQPACPSACRRLPTPGTTASPAQPPRPSPFPNAKGPEMKSISGPFVRGSFHISSLFRCYKLLNAARTASMTWLSATTMALSPGNSTVSSFTTSTLSLDATAAMMLSGGRGMALANTPASLE